MLSDHIAPVALAFAVLDVEDSAAAVGTVLAARIVPMVLLALIGGVWADRLPRNLAVLVLAGQAELWHFIVLQILNGAATAFFQPAATGLTPLTVREQHLQQANALISLSVSAAVIVGPMSSSPSSVPAGAWPSTPPHLP